MWAPRRAVGGYKDPSSGSGVIPGGGSLDVCGAEDLTRLWSLQGGRKGNRATQVLRDSAWAMLFVPIIFRVSPRAKSHSALHFCPLSGMKVICEEPEIPGYLRNVSPQSTPSLALWS